MSKHFKGKSVPEHLKEARKKGAILKAEIHGSEVPSHVIATTESMKLLAVTLLIGWLIQLSLQTLGLLSFGLILFIAARSALNGWSRMERLHRVIEEERFEIEHHRQQEREELSEIYEAKGFSGKLLEEVIDCLMADDNRLLQIMLEEELGLSLEQYEHPLKQSLFALLGALISTALCLIGYILSYSFGLPLAVFLITIFSTVLSARMENSSAWQRVVWNCAILVLVGGAIIFAQQFIKGI
ncbi:VIT1/CCC1 transporter family protein [Candidatus Rhabdochlamydia sp. T3358]|jgi:VIT1/CCC1 family predicted Fe2+/Mn2+ transporter|uniref:VIT1/CCC1 transporter family protein n=1 Tax=Candidatus Rhabdochlamydia sp. T3358 TaxID=2099795 RepID=UPI0010B33215|nr:VIT1/CCC1 transporter family protein [Candidatus Rhabdochlamydia sp. T3358]VHO02040.1 VIT family protein [Candidatus Rhabdochlamydia sp. T3358]